MASKYDRLGEENAAPPGTPCMTSAPPYPSAPPPAYSSTPVVNVGQAPVQTRINRTVIEMPPTYMAVSILSCLFCCWPLGICAIIKSNEVSDHWASGNIQAANQASKDARQLGKVTMIVGGIIHGLWVVLVILYFTVFASLIN